MVIRRRLDVVGPALAFITTGIQNGVPILSESSVADLIVSQLAQTVSREQLSLAGYVIMPNHIHLLLGFPHIERMSAIIRDFKRMSARLVRETLSSRQLVRLSHKGVFKLWQRRFDDVIVFSEDQFRTKLNYIHRNPVRAGLVATETEFYYSSAKDWQGTGKGALEVDRDWGWLERSGA